MAAYLASIIELHPALALAAPVGLNIVCLRHLRSDDLNSEIVVQLQQRGIAAPSTTTINGQVVIRVNITNHRTVRGDHDKLVQAITDIAKDLTD